MPYKDPKSVVAIASLKRRQEKYKSKSNYKELRLRSHLKNVYGISLEAYRVLFESQSGLCAICGRAEVPFIIKNNDMGKLRIDYNHVTGKVRGLLCFKCNTALGMAEDNIDILKKMIDYIEKHK